MVTAISVVYHFRSVSRNRGCFVTSLWDDGINGFDGYCVFAIVCACVCVLRLRVCVD